MINQKEYGITIGYKHTYRDFGLVMTSKVITPPQAQKHLVNVVGRNGALDLTEVATGNVRYNNRTITATFVSQIDVENLPVLYSDLQNYIQGQKLRFVFDDDLAFYWLGRASISMEIDGMHGAFTLTAEVEPYKYNITTSEEDWLWDPFDFEQGVINEFSDIEVDGTREVVILASERWENPIITATNAMRVTFNGNTYNLVEGSQVMYEIILTEGEQKLTFEGNGNVSINYVGGSL